MAHPVSVTVNRSQLTWDDQAGFITEASTLGFPVDRRMWPVAIVLEGQSYRFCGVLGREDDPYGFSFRHHAANGDLSFITVYND